MKICVLFFFFLLLECIWVMNSWASSYKHTEERSCCTLTPLSTTLVMIISNFFLCLNYLPWTALSWYTLVCIFVSYIILILDVELFNVMLSWLPMYLWMKLIDLELISRAVLFALLCFVFVWYCLFGCLCPLCVSGNGQITMRALLPVCSAKLRIVEPG